MRKKLTLVLAGCIFLGLALPACRSEAGITEQSIPTSTTLALPLETSSEAKISLDAGSGQPDVLTAVPDQKTILPADNVQDLDDGPVHIYAFSEDLRTQIDSLYLLDHPDFKYDYQMVSPADYEKRLSALFSSTDQMPDIIMLGASFAAQYTGSAEILGVDRLGIGSDELADQYSFSHQYMTDSTGSIKALAWKLSPVGLYYNRTVAKMYLGTSDPQEVSEHFSSWNSFLESARNVNEKSGGTVKVVADMDALCRGYMFSRINPWIQDEKVVWDQHASDFLDFYQAITGENLTFNEARGSQEWWAHGKDQSVLAYLMTYEEFTTKMGFALPVEGEEPDPNANPTSGDWALCEAPADFFLDGVWLAATADNDKMATTAELFRYFTISRSSLEGLADTGFFVNSKSVMDNMAKAVSRNDPFLAGQNPYTVLAKSAGEIHVSFLTERDEVIEAVFFSVTRAYASGAIPRKSEAEEMFLTDCEDLGFASD